MAVSRTVKVHDNGRRLTLGDVRKFVADCDQAGAADSTPVDAQTTWRGGLQRLEAEAVRFVGTDEPRRA